MNCFSSSPYARVIHLYTLHLVYNISLYPLSLIVRLYGLIFSLRSGCILEHIGLTLTPIPQQSLLPPQHRQLKTVVHLRHHAIAQPTHRRKNTP